ncbi:MAG: RNA degradosome polyphosphate kinase, partial [Hyphomicrobium sp.]
MASAKGKLKTDSRATEPVAVPDGPERFYNRELSWLQFNRRVLEEARNKNHPVLERLRFLSISASNLDEFYMVRAAGIYGQIAAGVQTLTQDGLTPRQQLAEINRFAAKLVADKQACWDDIKKDMAGAGVEIVTPDALSSADKEWLERLFMSHVFPIVTPIAVDPAHPFPFIPNLGLTMVVWMQRKSDAKAMSGL